MKRICIIWAVLVAISFTSSKVYSQCLQLGINTVASNFSTKCVGDSIILELTQISSNPSSAIYVVSLNNLSNILDTIFSPVQTQYLLPLTTPTCGLPNNSLLVFVQAIDSCWPSGQQYPTVAVGPIYVAEPPIASFTLPSTPCVGDVVTLNGINIGGYDPSPGINCSNTNWFNPVWTITPGIQGIDWNIISGSLTQTNPAPQISFTTPGSYNVSFTGSNSCASSIDSAQFNVNVCSGINTADQINQDFSINYQSEVGLLYIYPNKNSNLKSYNVQVLDINGKSIKYASSNSNNSIIVPVSDFSNGFYFVNVHSKNGKSIQKFYKF